MICCNKVKDLLSEYIDGELDDNTKSIVENHVAVCKSCREELKEIKMVVEMCSSIQQEEIPARFKDDLHRKLMEVNFQAEKRRYNASLKMKYIKVFASIAAGLFIMVFLKGMFGGMRYARHDMSDRQQNSTVSSGKDESPNTANAASKPYITNDLSGRVSQNENGSASLNNISAASSQSISKSRGAGQAYDNVGQSGSIADYGEDSNYSTSKAEGSSPGYATADEKKPVYEIKQSSVDGSTAVEESKSSVDYGSSEVRNASIVIYSSSLQNENEKIKEWVEKNGGSFINENGTACITAAHEIDTAEISEMDIKIPQPLNEFIDFVRTDVGESNVEVYMNVAAPTGSSDIDENLNKLYGQVIDVSRQINEIETGSAVASQDQLADLKSQRENLLAQISKIKEKEQYSYVHITIKKK